MESLKAGSVIDSKRVYKRIRFVQVYEPETSLENQNYVWLRLSTGRGIGRVMVMGFGRSSRDRLSASWP